MKSKLMADGNFEVWENGDIYRVKDGQKQKANVHFAGKNKQYAMVTYKTNGKQRYFYVHRLVAQAFLPNPLNLSQVGHKDGNTKNNHVDNLQWQKPQFDICAAYKKSVSKLCRFCGELTCAKNGICTKCKKTLAKESRKREREAALLNKYQTINYKNLSDTQLQFINAKMDGLTYQEIAEKFGVSYQYVGQVIRNVYQRRK